MRFMLLVHTPHDGWDGLTETAAQQELDDRAAAVSQLRDSGRLIACSPFAAPREGREVRVRNGEPLVSGIADTAAPIAGFYLMEAEDLDEAVAIAASIPDSAAAHLTVRSLMPLPGIPGELPPAVPGGRPE